MAAVTSVEDVCNLALDAIGYPEAIGNIFEGSKASRIALRVYGQARDAVLKAKDYPFARRDVLLTLNGQTAPPPWKYEYGFPADCLRIRQVMPSPGATFPVIEPYAVLFTDYNDARVTPPVRAILANISPAALVYTAQVVDPTTWDTNFIDILVADLGRRFSIGLRESAEIMSAQASTEEAALGMTLGSQANQPPIPLGPTRAQPRGGN